MQILATNKTLTSCTTQPQSPYQTVMLWSQVVVPRRQCTSTWIQNVKSKCFKTWTSAERSMPPSSMDHMCTLWVDMMGFKTFSWTAARCIIFIRMNGSILHQWTFPNVRSRPLLLIRNISTRLVGMMDSKGLMLSRGTILRTGLGSCLM